MQTLTLSNIPELQWGDFMHALAGAGWSLTKGGGLDHSWATLADGTGDRIDMEYDIWMQGDITITATDIARIADALPTRLRPMLGVEAAASVTPPALDVR